MTPTIIPGANTTYHAPAGWDSEKNGECSPLHVALNPEQGTIMSAWKPSPEELAALNNGSAVILVIHGTTQPPVALVVTQDPIE